MSNTTLRTLLQQVVDAAHYCDAFKGRVAHITEGMLVEIEEALKAERKENDGRHEDASGQVHAGAE